ncbi:MAG TPA: VCBS repeat-containing protein, partial [Acidobacteriota bacterium]
HASLVTDLDGDGTAELYVASDDQGVVRRYVWNGVALERSTIFERKVPRSVLTWNIMPVPAELLRAGAPPPAPDPVHRSPQAAPRR